MITPIARRKLSNKTFQIVARHQERARGTTFTTDKERQRAVDDAVRSYARYWFESLRLSELSQREIEARFSYEGLQHVDHALEQGKGVVVALPHMGSWEWAGAWMAPLGYEVTVVVERVKPPELFEWFREMREGMGIHVVAHDDNAAQVCTEALSKNHVVGLLCDRDIGGKGTEVTFFGEKTTMPVGPALLAIRNEAPLVVAAVYQRPHGYVHGVVTPPLEYVRTDDLRADVSNLMQKLAAVLEDFIRRAPEQWHLFQPNWPSDRELIDRLKAEGSKV